MSTGALPVGTTIQVNQNGLVLLGVYTASGGASIDIVSRNVSGQSGAIFQSDYDEYEFDFQGIFPGTAGGVEFWMRMGTGAGPTYDTGANYGWAAVIWRAAATAFTGAEGGATKIAITYTNNFDNASTGGLYGHIKLFNPLSTTTFKYTVGEIAYTGNPFRSGVINRGDYDSTTPLTAVQFLMSTGTVTGAILVYGKAKSTTPSAVISQIGRVVKEDYFQTGVSATGTTIIPLDTTIPQNTEGDQYMSFTYTPTSAANRLKIDIVFFCTNSVQGSWVCVALFQDSNANAIATFTSNNGAVGGGPCNSTFTHRMIAGTISPITFKVRAGMNVAGTVSFNGGTNTFGGTLASSISVTEYLV